jgi:hypothetical protein
MRTPVELRSTEKIVFKDFKAKYPQSKVTFDEWKNIVYCFNEDMRDYALETGEFVKFPWGFGEFGVIKKKRKRIKSIPDGREFINLPVDWKRTREKGKIVYNFNFHTEGYFFGWKWNKKPCRLKLTEYWYFKPGRSSSRIIAHYLKSDPKYQDIYQEKIR